MCRVVQRLRAVGHTAAHLDPLTAAPCADWKAVLQRVAGAEAVKLCVSEWAASTAWDSVALGPAPVGGATSIRDALQSLATTYASTVGVEFEHVESEAEAEWFREQLEQKAVLSAPLSAADQHHILRLLVSSESLDHYLAKKYATLKRYGMEGVEASMVAIDAILRTTAAVGPTSDTVIGMAHRGRLNVLLYLFNFEKSWLFYKLRGHALLPSLDYGALDDVLSHLSASTDLPYGNKSMHVSLIHNPSHLEAVNPVALGKAYAKQQRKSGPNATMCMMVHGDAALIGQGVNAETAIIGGVPGYNVGGVVHVVTNNQLGFTAFPKESRPTRYATDLAKMTGTPVIHVNADAPEAVLRASRLAAAYRENFHKDIYLDVIGWRKWGHNELDEPAFTQPTMYGRIRARTSTPAAYSAALVKAGVISVAQLQALKSELEQELDAAFSKAQSMPPPTPDQLHLAGPHWGSESLVHPPFALRENQLISDPETNAASIAELQHLGRLSVTVPAGTVQVHERLQRTFIEARLGKLNDASGTQQEVDWATAEALAFGSSLVEGHPIRISGQDSARGTFSQRHARLVDQTDEARSYVPLNNLAPKQAPFEVISSPLSEMAALGFEYGYSAENPRALTIWEAQFGDFGSALSYSVLLFFILTSAVANGAQTIIDTFVASGEDKWLRQSGLIMLLPHGYDGAGPEHSSSRIERFLQLINTDALSAAAENYWNAVPNMGLINPTTPQNYFHALRRQIKRNYRKPLVVIAPKTLIRHAEAVCSLAELATAGQKFEAVYTDSDINYSDSDAIRAVKTVFLCSGKLFYDLRKEKRTNLRKDIAIVRIEELAPFPHEALKKALSIFNQATKYVWVQEEPQNQGAWSYVEPRLRHLVGIPPRMLSYIGQPPLAASAVGSYDLHNIAVKQLFRQCFETK